MSMAENIIILKLTAQQHLLNCNFSRLFYVADMLTVRGAVFKMTVYPRPAIAAVQGEASDSGAEGHLLRGNTFISIQDFCLTNFLRKLC